MQDLTGKAPLDTLTAAEWNQLPTEIQNMILSAGITLSGGDLTQFKKSFAEMSNSCEWMTVGGVTNAWTLTAISPRPAITSLHTGMMFRFRVAADNSSSSVTLNVQGTGVKTVTTAAGSSTLQLGDVNLLSDTIVRYDGTNWVLVNEYVGTGGGGSGDLPPGHYNGLRYVFDNAGSTAGVSQLFDTEAGKARNWTDTDDLVLTSTLSKDARVTWAEGDGLGCLAPGLTLAANTWYRRFLVQKSDGTPEIVIDTSPTAGNFMGSATGDAAGFLDYALYRRIGWLRTDASKDLHWYIQSAVDPNRWTLRVPLDLSNSSVPITTRAAWDLSTLAPPSTDILGSLTWVPGTSGNELLVSTEDQADSNPGNIFTIDNNESGGNYTETIRGQWELNSSSELYVETRTTSGTGVLYLTCDGWFDWNLVA